MSVLLQRHLGKYIGQLAYHKPDSLNRLHGTGMADSQWHWMEKNKNLKERKRFCISDNIRTDAKSEPNKTDINLPIIQDETKEWKIK